MLHGLPLDPGQQLTTSHFSCHKHQLDCLYMLFITLQHYETKYIMERKTECGN